MKLKYRSRIEQRSEEGGYVLLLAIIITISLFIALSGVLSLSLTSLSSAKRSVYDDNALYVAEAGIDNAVSQFNANTSYTGTNTTCPIGTTGESPVTLASNSTQGKETYENCIVAGSIANEYVVYSEGKIYRRTTDTTPISTRTVKAVLEGSQSSGYSVVVGPGGLIMSNSATITNGPVAIGGFLSMSNTASIGTSTNNVNVTVANNRCPPGAGNSYPFVCSAGSDPNPTTMTNTSKIYGNLVSNDQEASLGTHVTGTVITSGATVPTMPNPARWDTSGATTLTSAAASCSHSTTVTWPANVVITGNVTESQSCTVIVSGNTDIQGSLSLSNSSVIEPLSTLTSMPFVEVDGSGGISFSNTSKASSNANNQGIQFVAYYSTAACSPTCTSVTGTDLYNSQSINTISLGNSGLASGSTFEALWTEITLANGGSLGGVMGQTINVSNNGNISFNSASIGGSWTYDVRYYEVE